MLSNKLKNRMILFADFIPKSLFFFSYFFAHMKECVILKKQERKE